MASVQRTHEFIRILDLKRRAPWSLELAQQAAEYMTDVFALPTKPPEVKLWPVQGACLAELYENPTGLIANVEAGGGKAWVSLLAPGLLEARNPLLIVPASLRAQTHKVIANISEWWNFPVPRVMSYAQLSQAKNATALMDDPPDFITLDEAHRAANPKSARTKRLKRFVKEHPNVPVVLLTGTLHNKSLMQIGHLCQWALRDNSPLPMKWRDLADWAGCIDDKVAPDMRVAPGYFNKITETGQSPRQWVSKRMRESWGFVSTWKPQPISASLQVKLHSTKPTVGDVAKAALEKTQQTWVDPNGDLITDTLSLWRVLRQLSLGFWSRWDPKPPREWLDARWAWNSYVQHRIKYNRSNIDTPLQVWNECERMENKPAEFSTWKQTRKIFSPTVVTEWLDTGPLETACKWAENNNGIIWSENVAFGTKLAEAAGIPYFGAGSDKRLANHSEGAAVLAVQAHSEGKNLQQFSANLFLAPPSSGKTMEQALARTHRYGQTADVVTVDVWLGSSAAKKTWKNLQSHTEALQELDARKYRLGYCDYV